MIRKVDDLWKGMMEDIFPDFIQFMHPGVDESLDFERGFEFLDKELRQVFPPDNEIFTPKEVDKLIKVFTKTGQEQCILIHVEVQGKYTKDFPERMFKYFYRIRDKYNLPISAYAIFTEDIPKIRPDTYRSEYLGTELSYRYNLYKITESTHEELMANVNPFAIVVMAVKIASAGNGIKDIKESDQLKKRLKLDLVKHLFSRNIAKHKTDALLNFIIYYSRFELDETKAEFDKELDILLKNKKTMGIREQILEMSRNEGIEAGLEKGRKEIYEKLARKCIHHLGYTDQQAADFLELPLKMIKSIRKQKNELLSKENPELVIE